MPGDVELDGFRPTGLLGRGRDTPIAIASDGDALSKDSDNVVEGLGSLKPTGLLRRANTSKNAVESDMHVDVDASELVVEGSMEMFRSTGLLSIGGNKRQEKLNSDGLGALSIILRMRGTALTGTIAWTVYGGRRHAFI